MRCLWEKDLKSTSRPQLTEPLLQYASETELPVEEIVETALRNYLERSQDNA